MRGGLQPRVHRQGHPEVGLAGSRQSCSEPRTARGHADRSSRGEFMAWFSTLWLLMDPRHNLGAIEQNLPHRRIPQK